LVGEWTVAFRFAPDATNARSSQVYILTISEIANDRFWPRLCKKSSIYSQIGVARKFAQFLVSLSEIVVAALKFSAWFVAK
jgi:hypothetical protein